MSAERLHHPAGPHAPRTRSGCTIPHGVFTWYWLFTDGDPADEDNGSFEELLRLQNAKKAVFYGVAVGNERKLANLGAMNKDGCYLQISKEGFKEAFKFLSESVIEASDPESPEGLITVPESDEIKVMRVEPGTQIKL